MGARSGGAVRAKERIELHENIFPCCFHLSEDQEKWAHTATKLSMCLLQPVSETSRIPIFLGEIKAGPCGRCGHHGEKEDAHGHCDTASYWGNKGA